MVSTFVAVLSKDKPPRPQVSCRTCIPQDKHNAGQLQVTTFWTDDGTKSLAWKSASREARGYMRLSTWVQFTWNLKTLPAETAKLATRYTVETATLDDRNL